MLVLVRNVSCRKQTIRWEIVNAVVSRMSWEANSIPKCMSQSFQILPIEQVIYPEFKHITSVRLCMIRRRIVQLSLRENRLLSWSMGRSTLESGVTPD
jgi:hypothetical protein